MNLAKQSYLQSVTALGQGVAQNQTAVSTVQTTFKDLQTKMSALQTRETNLGITNQQLEQSQQSLKAAKMIGNISVATAQANNRVVTQAGRITAATGQNSTFTSSLNNVVSAGQDYNLKSLNNYFKQAPDAVAMTSTGLVIPTKILNESLNAVQATAGAGVGKVRYDSPAVLNMAQRKTHDDFASAYPSAAAVLLAKTPNAVGMSSANILREGRYDTARKLAPVNLTGTPSASYRYPYLPPKVVWGDAVPPASASWEPARAPRPDNDFGLTPEQRGNVLYGDPSRSKDNTEPQRRAP